MTPWTDRIVDDGSDRNVWLETRKRFITASEVASLLGVGYDSYADLVARKAGLHVYKFAKASTKIGKLNQVRAGTHFEAGALAWFQDDHPELCVDPSRSLIRSDTIPTLAATTDALVMESHTDFPSIRPLDAKIVGESGRKNWSQFSRGPDCDALWSDLGKDHAVDGVIARHYFFPTEFDKCAFPVSMRDQWTHLRAQQKDLLRKMGPVVAPAKFWLQLQVQMHVLGADSGWLVAVIGGTSRTDLHYRAKPSIIEKLTPLIAKFWRNVERARNT